MMYYEANDLLHSSSNRALGVIFGNDFACSALRFGVFLVGAVFKSFGVL